MFQRRAVSFIMFTYHFAADPCTTEPLFAADRSFHVLFRLVQGFSPNAFGGVFCEDTLFRFVQIEPNRQHHILGTPIFDTCFPGDCRPRALFCEQPCRHNRPPVQMRCSQTRSKRSQASIVWFKAAMESALSLCLPCHLPL